MNIVTKKILNFSIFKFCSISILLLFVCACNNQLGNPSISNTKSEKYFLPDNITANTKLSFETLNLESYDKKENVKEEIKSWFNYALVKHKKIVVDKVFISGTTQRIDDKGTDSIKPDYSGGETVLTISGKFNEDIINHEHIFFKNEANLLQVSFVGEDEPKTKILIDDSILLEPVSATKDEIKVKVKTEAIADYYLKGMHKLSIVSEDKEKTDTLIRIGTPEVPKVSLSPVINEIKILKVKDIYVDKNNGLAFKVAHEDNDDDFKKYDKETPIAIKIKGKNFPMFYKFAYIRIDQRFSWGHSTIISKDNQGNTVWESIIHIAEPKEFKKLTSHVLSYSTPFGTSINKF